MFQKEKQPKSINFLETLYDPSDVWSNAYLWLVSIGKYLLIAVQVIVLGVFFSRFVLDRKNNDLTEEINNKVVLLSNDTWEKNAFLFENYQVLLSDIRNIREGQVINSLQIRELISGIPGSLVLEGLSFNEGRVSLRLSSNNLNTVKDYESALKNNPMYEDVKFSITKEDAEITVGVSFYLNTDGEVSGRTEN
jgi:Tfp pilus assembly protein PilN